MNKYMDKVKSRTVKVMMIGCCFTVLWAGAAYAETGASTDQRSVVSQETGISDVLLQKQKEIDKYVFEQHADELANKGITVTNTGPVGNVVEIGITPYNKANADYLYGIFGTEIVKVVEGTQAVTFSTAVAPVAPVGKDMTAMVETPAEIALLEKQRQIDKYVFEQHADELAKKGITVTNTGPVGGAVEIGITPYNEANADYLYGIFGKEMVKVVEGQQAVTLGSGSEGAANFTTSADTAKVAGVAKAVEAGMPNLIIAIIILTAALIIGGTTFFVHRQRMAKS